MINIFQTHAGWCHHAFQNQKARIDEEGGGCLYSAIVSFSNRNSQLMIAYCTRVSQDPRSVRFLFDGNFLDPEGSAETLNMEDGDEIDAMLSQIGGDKHRH